jgi:outer membrane protein OmpA-like peptidoglycan-associated protein
MFMGAVAALSLTAQAQALPDGWYLSLEGGGNWVQDWDFDSVTALDTFAGTAAFENGWAVLASVGYGHGSWAAEFETGFRRNDSDGVTVNAVVDAYDSVRLNETTFMANIKYNYPLMQKLTLSVGAGLGADFAEVRVRDGASVTEDEDWNLAYQGIVSLGYAVGQRSELFASYRYFRTTAAEFDLTPTFDAVFDGDEFQKHTATLGFRYYLNGGSEPEPAQAPPPPPPADAGSPSEFIIFFGHNKAELTPAAMDVVREAASAAKEDGIANVKLVGHADRSGSDTYNQALSLRRANAVKSALVREGVTESTIVVDGRGESDPMVPTADGVREPQNRRVNISF